LKKLVRNLTQTGQTSWDNRSKFYRNSSKETEKLIKEVRKSTINSHKSV
jgi:hypothetical protein